MTNCFFFLYWLFVVVHSYSTKNKITVDLFLYIFFLKWLLERERVISAFACISCIHCHLSCEDELPPCPCRVTVRALTSDPLWLMLYHEGGFYPLQATEDKWWTNSELHQSGYKSPLSLSWRPCSPVSVCLDDQPRSQTLLCFVVFLCWQTLHVRETESVCVFIYMCVYVWGGLLPPCLLS